MKNKSKERDKVIYHSFPARGITYVVVVGGGGVFVVIVNVVVAVCSWVGLGCFALAGLVRFVLKKKYEVNVVTVSQTTIASVLMTKVTKVSTVTALLLVVVGCITSQEYASVS